jgi:TraB/PrgY/gumN family
VGRIGAVIATGLAMLSCIDARAQEAVGPQPAIEEVLVTGQQPGPGLWKVTRPTDGNEHVLWILGSYGPLPKKMSWRSAELEAALAGSQAVIAPVSMRASVGALGGVTLLPSLVGLRRNPDGARLEDVVPPELYARWLPLKERYIGRDEDVEKWRPIFAAQKLYEQALRRSGLEPYGVVWPAVEKRARKARVRIVEPEVEVRIDKPRAAIKDFKQAPLDDLECFAKTIERLESDLELMRVRANAWASGDVQKLRALAPVDNASACIAVALNAEVLRQRGAGDWPAQRATAWLEAVEKAFAANASTVAVLNVEQILRPDGYVAELRARGYVVEDP